MSDKLLVNSMAKLATQLLRITDLVEELSDEMTETTQDLQQRIAKLESILEKQAAAQEVSIANLRDYEFADAIMDNIRQTMAVKTEPMEQSNGKNTGEKEAD